MTSFRYPQLAKILLFISFFLLGFYFINAQVILVREFLVVLFGNELCLGSIMASWFVGIAIGAGVASWLADRFKSHITIFIWLESALCIVLPIQIYSIRSLRTIVNIPSGEIIPFASMILSTLIIILPLSILVGLIFPIACKVLSLLKVKGSVAVGSVYLIESIGSLIGGMLFSFLLVIYFHPFMLIALLSLLLLTNASFIPWAFYGKKAIKTYVPLSILVVIFLILIMLPFNNQINHFTIIKRWKSINDKLKLVYYTDSKYQHISLGLKDNQYSLFGNGTYHFSFPDEYQNAQTAHFILAQHPKPQRILLIGSGIAGLIEEIAQHPIEILDYVQLDPMLITAIRKYLPEKDKDILKDHRIRLHSIDGRRFIKLTDEKYDMIILNIPDPSTAMINRFYTLEFFQEAKNRLKPNGILVTHLSSTINYVGGEIGAYNSSLYYTLQEVFPHLLVVPGQVQYYFASKSANILTANSEVLAKRFEHEGIDTPYFNRYTFEYLIEPNRVYFIEKSLKEMDNKELNTDNQPVTYFFNLIIWNQLTTRVQQTKIRGKAERFFIAIRNLRLGWLILPLIMLAIIRIIYVLVKKKFHARDDRFNILFAIATTGFMAMAVEMILIFAFQNIYGYIYQKIGIIVAVFMFGLAIGSWLMNRKLKTSHQKRSWQQWFILFEILILTFCLMLPTLISLFSNIQLHIFSSEYFFMLILFIAGIFTGLEFPLAAELYLSTQEGKIGRISGLVDGADHLGAFFGAILTGIIFAPLLGIAKTCWLLGALKGVSLLFLISAFLFSGRIKAD